MIAPKIPFVKNGQILTANLVNHIIARTEYASRLLREYRCVAGTDMFIEPHYDGTRVSIGTPVGGGADSYGGGAGSANKPITIGRLPSVVILRSSAMDAGEILTWSISGNVASAQLLPFPGNSSTRARMSGNTITVDPEDDSDRKFIVVIRGSNLNNFSISKGGSVAAGTIIDVTFQRIDGASFKFSDFCGIVETSIGQAEALGTCFFYPSGPPPGNDFDGVGNYWLVGSGSNMTFRINVEKEKEYSATEALSAFSSIVYTEDRIYFDFSDLGSQQIMFEEDATRSPGVGSDIIIRFWRTDRNLFLGDSESFFVDGKFLSQRIVNQLFLLSVPDKRFYITFPFPGGSGTPPRPPNNLRIYLL